MELLQAFGKIKSFHLVKNDPDSITSKGYCFVEYADPNVTQVAVLGLNGMDLGGGKVLTARVAAQRAGATGVVPSAVPAAAPGGAPAPGAPPAGAIIVSGYDIEALVDAAMGLKPMPTAPMHVDQFGKKELLTLSLITRVATQKTIGKLTLPLFYYSGVPITTPNATVPIAPAIAAAQAVAPAPASALPPGASALDIANAALSAAFGSSSPAKAPPPAQTRVLVLLNMVEDDDLSSDENYRGLMEEVEEESAKFGKLLSMKVPRHPSGDVQPSAIKKIFLEYATVQDAVAAERELGGRQFGPNVVQVCSLARAVRCRTISLLC